MIGIVDYGLGNLKAFLNVYERLNLQAKLVQKSHDFSNVSKIILPGVGSFDHAMNQLNRSGLRDQLEVSVHRYRIPLIGICVGMQMLAESSEEGSCQGLGWLSGTVKKFDINTIPFKTKLPHMGWNSIDLVRSHPLIDCFESTSRFYFLHSYFFDCKNSEDILLRTNYGIEFTCAVSHENILGVQFHPEKSHKNGVDLLKNFAISC